MKTKNKKAALLELDTTPHSLRSLPDDMLEIAPAVDSETTEEQIERITKELFGPRTNSENRLPTMTNHGELFSCKQKVVWPVFHTIWNACDATWNHREDLADFLDLIEPDDDRGNHSCNYLTPEDRVAFKSLPDHIRIYRGCSLSRVYGFSWTTDRKIAEGFARGHRGISVPDPVIATLRIPKRYAIGFYTGRKEQELLVDYRDIQRRYAITFTSFWGY